jgi:NADH-quinone oxidoreductase subunit D
MLDLGVTGPMLRAAGLKIDARKTRRIPATRSSISKCRRAPRTTCSRAIWCASRRCGSRAKIIRQALEGMPSGSHQADAPGIVLPDREKMKTQMEALIYHFKIVTEGFRVPEGEVYQAIESPRGEVGCYMVSDGTQKPYRVHWRGPSFGNLQAIPRK